MSTVILLTAAQATQVRGTSAETALSALQPVPLSDGRYILGVEVLTVGGIYGTVRTLRDDGWTKVLAGITTFEEVIRAAEADEAMAEG